MRALLVACALTVGACSSSATPPAPAGDPQCDDRSVLTAEGCVAVGATECGPGFTLDGPRCVPQLPEPCARGTFAVPGDAACRAPSTIPLDGTIVYVDGAAAAGGDGSMGKPFATIQAAVNAAPVDARIAIAPGTYRENVRVARKLTLIGAGADKVEIVGVDSARATLELRAASTIAGVAVTGNGIGIAITDTSATLREVWVHDTRVVGVNIDVATGASSAHIERSLIESTGYAGVAVFGGEAEIVSSAVRDTRILDGAGGPGALAAFYKGKRPKLTILGSLIERNHETGVGVSGGDLIVEDSIVRDTGPMADGTVGTGVLASFDKTTKTEPTLLVRRSVIENNREMGIALSRGTGTIEQTVVADTLFRTKDSDYGVGIQADPGAVLTVRNTLVTRSRHMGIAYFGSTGTVEGTLVRETLLDGTNESAVGIAATEAEGRRANVTLTRTLADRNLVAGVLIGAADATLIECSARNTLARSDGIFGDGVVGLSAGPDRLANLTIDGLTALGNARAGVTLFGGTAVVGRSRLMCNAFDLNVESYPAEIALTDAGGNVCGCDQHETCRAQSNTLLVQVQPIPN